VARSLGKPGPEEIFTREYWLRHCEDFFVETSSGCDVGYVEEVLLTPTGDAAALVVWVDRDDPHRITIPVEDVLALDPELERLEVRAHPTNLGADDAR
jgi:hypothetical protein